MGSKICAHVHVKGVENLKGFFLEENKEERQVEDDDVILRGNCGARIRLQGSSKYVSMFTR